MLPRLIDSDSTPLFTAVAVNVCSPWSILSGTVKVTVQTPCASGVMVRPVIWVPSAYRFIDSVPGSEVPVIVMPSVPISIVTMGVYCWRRLIVVTFSQLSISVIVSPSEGVQSVIVSSPLPHSNSSAPGPPVSVSSPLLPKTLSLPSPPSITSFPLLPLRLSFPPQP